MGERQAFRDAIVADEEVERLLERLTLVERFHAVLVTCEMPRVANALVEILETELPQRRGEAMQFVRLDPYGAHKDILAPIPADLLIDEVLAKIVHPPAENQGSSVVTIVDASRALPKDDDAWSIMFQRMNERRNAIMRALPGPFLIVAPNRFDVLFARSAADFWSILGAIVPVKTPAINEEWQVIRQLNDSGGGPSPRLMLLSSMMRIPQDKDAISAAENALKSAREHCAQYPNDEEAAAFVAAELIQLGILTGLGAASEHLSRSNAITWLDEALEILCAQTNLANDPVTVVFISHALLSRGFMHLLEKRFQKSLDDVEQSTLWARLAATLEPDSIASDKHLASNLVMLGNLQIEMGNLGRAVENFSEAILRYRELLSTTGDTADVLWEIASALNYLGDAYSAERDIERALSHYEEAAETSHRALQQSSAKANGTASLAMALLSASRIQFVRGDYGRSVRLAEQARDTLDPTPTSDFFTNALANDIRAHLAQLKAPQ